MLRPRLAAALLLPALVFTGLYLRALDYEFVWTDKGEIEQESLIRPPDQLLDAFQRPMHANLDFRLAGTRQSFYRPLQVALVSLIHEAHGKEPRYYRAASLAIGAATAVLFAALAWLLFRRLGPALLAGTILAVHPGGVEVYVWISGLSAALADFFAVLSLLAAVLALRAQRMGPRILLSLLSAFALVLGLLSKEHAVVIPALVFACAVSLDLLDRRPSREGGAPRWTPLRGTAGAILLVQGLLVLSYVAWWRPRVLGGVTTGAPPIGGSAETQLLSALALWPRSLGWLLLPLQSTTSDVVRVVSSVFDPIAWLGILLAAASLVACFLFLRRGWAVAALAIAWIWIAYLPTAGLLPLLHARAERNLCLSVFGVALLWPAVGTGLLGALRRRDRHPKETSGKRNRFAFGRVKWGSGAVGVALALLLVAALAQRTWSRTPDWRSRLTLFERDVARDPLYREGKYQLAAALFHAGRGLEAKQQLEALFAVNSQFEGWSSYLRAMDARELSCVVNQSLGHNQDTVRFFDEGLGSNTRLTHSMPGFMFCNGHALESVGRVEEALEIYSGLLRLDPASPHPSFVVAVARCHATLGRRAEAREWLAKIPRETVQDRALEAEIIRVRRVIRLGAQPARPSRAKQGRRR
jgi:tetratricopeptide (TPR) repeat protein